jgi:hypothetical protein
MHARWLLSSLAWFVCLAPLGGAEPKQTYDVPYRLADSKHIVVRAKINGKGPLNLILDTGAPALFLTKAAGEKLGLKEDRRGWVTLGRLEVEGGATLPKARARIDDLAPIEAANGLGLAGVELHGLIGYTVLAHYRIELDFTRDKMKWTRLDFEPELPRAGGKGTMPANINALGALMKFVGVLLGKRGNAEAVPRGFLGVELSEAAGAVEVSGVVADGPAARAGLRAGDRVTRFQDRAVKSYTQLKRRADQIVAGETVRVVVKRNDKEKEIEFKAGEGL